MTKPELFNYAQKYNNIYEKDLIRIPEISHYNHNYYKGKDGYILYGRSDDDNCTEWFLCDSNAKLLVHFGESFNSSNDIIDVFSAMEYMDFYV